ncbi:fatty acyl-CoA reductase 1-like isoform X1 [Mytilus galloprovincialis]|uniref:fatty acyl-CoA reductase 1-like isoform X1 n=1 Tax=Mytilus galloprovincialis TaxID=29158 RepID=UPI003F7B71DD
MASLHPTVSEYYTDKNVFITGATGFIGKVLLEKLLRSCPNVGNLYLLVRPKKSQDCHQRITEISQSPVFDKVRAENPNFDKKLIPIHGDITQEGLGISEENVELLENHVNIVFHSAATIRFDEPLSNSEEIDSSSAKSGSALRVAMEMNVLGVRKMIQLCNNFKKLEVFVHVSTAYANCDRPFIEEMVYQPSVEPQKLIDALDWLDDEMLDQITSKLIGDKPNTYTFTKQLAEHLLIKEGSNLPLAILRPSIVGASWKEPFPGWIDNFNGPSGLYVAAGKGILRYMNCDAMGVADIIPVDIPVNMMITMAWYTAVYKPSTVPIFHSTSGSVNPFTWGEIENVVMNFWKKVPLDSCFRRPKAPIAKSGFLLDYYIFVSHMIPAYFADLGYCMLGKRPRMVKIYNKLHRAMGTLTFFTTHSWEWTYNNLDMLKSKLSPEDRRLFYFDPRGLHWPTYLEAYCLGAKKYLLNEDLSGLPAAKAHLRNLRNLRYIFNTVVIVALWRVLVARSDIARNLWVFIIGLVTKFVKFFRLTSAVRR